MFFRPEEVVVPSAAAAKDERLLRRHSHDPSTLYDRVNRLGAVDARVEDLDLLLGVIAADQQQEVNRSGHIETLATR